MTNVKILYAVILFSLGLSVCDSANAFNTQGIREELDRVHKTIVDTLSPGPAAPTVPSVPAPQASDPEKALNDAFLSVMSTCEARTAALGQTITKQVGTAEHISIFGALAGVFGAVATNRGVQALFSGLSGASNTAQQIYRDNSDTAADTRAQLQLLSAKALADVDAYMKIAPVASTDPTYAQNLRSRENALHLLFADCSLFALTVANRTNATIPAAPADISATAGTGQATVSFTAPTSDGGSPITGYTVTATPTTGSPVTQSAKTSPVTIKGLTKGTSYTIAVTANNAVGASPAAKAASPITPN